MSPPPLPRLVHWLLIRAVPDDWRDSIAGDIEEERLRRAAAGRSAGTLWGCRQALAIAIRLRLSRPLLSPDLHPAAAIESARADLRQVLRGLFAARTYAITVMLTLAMGIGANAAAFAVAWHVLIKPLPWPDADDLVQIWNTNNRTGAVNVIAPANYLDFEREAASFTAIAAYTYFNYSLNLTGSGEPLEARVRAVTSDYFRVFGIPARLGRTLLPDDFRRDAFVLVISDGLWRRQFGAAPDVIGRRIQLDDRAYEIVGVMPGAFDISPRPLDGWVPYVLTPELRERRLGFFLGSVARLKPGVPLAQARDEIAAIAAHAGERHPASNANIGATLRSLRDDLVGPVRVGLLMVAGAAGLVLLVACANLTSLQLARGAGRRRELAILAALGATQGRLRRLVLAEGLVLALAGGLAGLFAGFWVVRGVAALAPPTLALTTAFSIDPAVVLFTFLVSIVSGVLVAVLPAWRMTARSSPDALRGRASADRGAGKLRATLVTIQVALATTLLVGASILVLSLTHVLGVDPGFDPAGVLAADLRLPTSRYPDSEQRSAFFDRLSMRLLGAAGIDQTCATNAVPFETPISMTYVPGGTTTLVSAFPITVSPGCFRALGVELRRGRLFDAHEPAPVAIVSERFAIRAWPDADPLGKIIHIGLPTGEPLTVVGIVRDSRWVSLESAPFAQVYEHARQSRYFAPSKILLHTTVAPETVVGVLRQAVSELDRAQPVDNIRSLDDVIARSLGSRRFNLSLLAGFAGLALTLAGVGIYGLLAHLVVQRRMEIGVRVALGAGPRTIVRLVVGGALIHVALGVLIGLAGAWAGSKLMARFAFETSATDPALYAGAASVLLLVAAAAAFLPMRRATRVDPVVALRSE